MTNFGAGSMRITRGYELAKNQTWSRSLGGSRVKSIKRPSVEGVKAESTISSSDIWEKGLDVAMWLETSTSCVKRELGAVECDKI